MIQVYAAGSTDEGLSGEVLYTRREDAEMACFLDFEWNEQTDSGNFVTKFESVPEARLVELLGSSLVVKPEEVRFLIIEDHGAPEYYVREVTVYDSTEERTIDLDPSRSA